MGFMRQKKVKQQKLETYYDEISDTTRSMVVWLDNLLRKPDDLLNMHEHHIHLIEMRAITSPFHKNKKIDAWIKNKINTVVSTHRYHKEMEEFNKQRSSK